MKTRPDRQTDKQPNKQRLRCRETITAWFRSPRRCHSPACDWLSCLDFVERTMMVCVIGPVACIHCSHPDWLSLTLVGERAEGWGVGEERWGGEREKQGGG